MAAGNSPPIRRIRLFPAFESRQELGDILNRLAWALGGVPPQDLEIHLSVGNGLSPERLDWRDLPVPESHFNYLTGSAIGELCRATRSEWAGLPASVKTLTLPEQASNPHSSATRQACRAPVDGSPISDSQTVVQWNVQRSGGAPLSGALVFDPHYYHDTEANAVASLCSRIAGRSALRQAREQSRQRFQRLVEIAAGRAPAVLFLTGPSLEAALGGELPVKRFSIICNSLVKNRAFLERIQPNLLVFLDPAYHFGVSRYAAEFRRSAVAALHDYPQCACLVPQDFLPLARSFLGPALEERLIGMPVRSRSGFNLPTRQAFYVQQTGNVLTQLMLPVGLALAEQAWVVGADGRRPDDPGFWAHSAPAQMGELLASIYAAHPSLGRDEDVPGYYDRHCRRVERLLRFGEAQAGRRVRSLTPSYIPALARRYDSSP